MRVAAFYAVLGLILAAAFANLAAVPQQGERPPTPFFQDFFSGAITLQGKPAPTGLRLIACVNGCTTGFESEPLVIETPGQYTLLEVNPSDDALIGLRIEFYLANDFGRIKAVETRAFVGVFNIYPQDLTFNGAMPSPTPTPTITPTVTLTPTAALPVPGDPIVTVIPRLALFIGAAAVATGIVLVLLARRKVEE